MTAIDADYLFRQWLWSQKTFGPGGRVLGVVDHIRKELEEVLEHPEDISEWADILILAFDGAMRAGHTPRRIIDAVHAKHAKNEQRTWPDWRTAPLDKAIEHIREEDDATTSSS